MSNQNPTEKRRPAESVVLKKIKKPTLVVSQKNTSAHLSALMVEESNERSCYIKGYN